jgi:hypothetical protein
MLVRLPEVGTVLALVITTIIGRHLPQTAGLLPWATLAGITCFAFAIYLSLRIFQVELARIRAEE